MLTNRSATNYLIDFFLYTKFNVLYWFLSSLLKMHNFKKFYTPFIRTSNVRARKKLVSDNQMLLKFNKLLVFIKYTKHLSSFKSLFVWEIQYLYIHGNKQTDGISPLKLRFSESLVSETAKSFNIFFGI